MTLFTTSGLRSSVRFCQILSDTMSPTIRRLDYVLVAPAHRYLGEGYYLVSDPDGEGAAVYSCSGAGTREVEGCFADPGSPLLRTALTVARALARIDGGRLP